MTRRSTLLRLLLVMLLGAIGWAGATSTAHAGGPTSVLMTNPESGRATALHIANRNYDRLYEAVGGDTAAEQARSTGLSSGGEEVRLTWLIHDVQVWRIDRVHLTRNDGIWLETVTQLTGEGHPFEQPSRWHRPKNDQALVTLLADAGLLSADSAPSNPSGADVTAASSAPAQPVLPIVAAAVGGLAVGAVGSLLLRRRPAVDRPRVTLSG